MPVNFPKHFITIIGGKFNITHRSLINYLMAEMNELSLSLNVLSKMIDYA